MKKLYLLALAAGLIGGTSGMSAYKVTVKWNEAGTVLLGTGSPANATIINLDATATEYEFEGSEYTELCMFPAEGHVLKSVHQSNQPEKNNSITGNAAHGQQSYYGCGSSWDGRTVTVETAKLVKDKSFSFTVENGADCFDAYLSKTESFGTGTLRYNYGYQQNLNLADGVNTVTYSAEYVKDLTIALKKGVEAKSIYKVTRNGEDVAITGNAYYLNDIVPTDKIVVRVYENEAPPAAPVTLTLTYPEAIEGFVRNIYDWNTHKFLGMDENYNFTMPADHKFTVSKGTKLQLNTNDGYTLTKFMLGDTDITADYQEENNKIIFTVNSDITLNVEGTVTQYEDIEFTIYAMNPDFVRLTLGAYGGVPNPIKDITGQAGEAITENIVIPSYTISDKDQGSGEDGNTGDNSITIPSVTMTPENTLKFTAKVSERNPYIYVSPVVGSYIQSLWDKQLNFTINYADGNDANQRTLYVVGQPLERSSQFTVEKNGVGNVDFRPAEFFHRNWDNPTVSFTVGDGTKTYDYCPEYDNPFTLSIPNKNSLTSVTLNGRQTGITETELGTYIIDFTKAYESSKYDIPTLKINTGSSAVEEIEEITDSAIESVIYNLQGVSVGNDINSLPGGLYIRDGKKIIKK